MLSLLEASESDPELSDWSDWIGGASLSLPDELDSSIGLAFSFCFSARFSENCQIETWSLSYMPDHSCAYTNQKGMSKVGVCILRCFQNGQSRICKPLTDRSSSVMRPAPVLTLSLSLVPFGFQLLNGRPFFQVFVVFQGLFTIPTPDRGSLVFVRRSGFTSCLRFIPLLSL